MRKKFLVIASLLVLFMFIDVKAVTCEYSSNDISVILTSDNLGWSVSGSGKYQVSTYSLVSSKNTCPTTIYYRCSSSICYIADTSSALPASLGTKYSSMSVSNNSGGGSGGAGWGGLGGGDAGDCQSIFGDLLEFLESYIFSPIRFLTPIVLVVLTSIDFAKSVFADDKDGIKKAQSNFVKRAVAALLIFLSPTIVSILLSLLNNASITDCLNSSGIAKL